MVGGTSGRDLEKDAEDRRATTIHIQSSGLSTSYQGRRALGTPPSSSQSGVSGAL